MNVNCQLSLDERHFNDKCIGDTIVNEQQLVICLQFNLYNKINGFRDCIRIIIRQLL